MIQKIGVVETINSSTVATDNKNVGYQQNPNFKGGAWTLVLQGLQECEKNPMVNVAVVDMLSAILPRTIVESLTNWFAGFEAFRRESSGLIVNCMTPGLIAMGVAALLNNSIMPNGAKMSSCFADSNLLEQTKELYEKSSSNDKVADTLRSLFENIQGYDGDKLVRFKDVIPTNELNEYIKKFSDLSRQNLKRGELKKEIEKITKEVAQKTHVYENINVNCGKGIKASNINDLMQNAVKIFQEYNKAQKVNPDLTITEYIKKAKKLARGKSVLGLAIILPLAASMQYINRWITTKVSGVKGAPIYEDFGQNDTEVSEKSKEGLLKQKIISISSMIGVGLLSMMKLPSWSMFEFKGIFPTMDQARIISATTFASRMAAADDKNELAEATVRDIATFISLYFLGDYVAKATATIIEKKTNGDIRLLNDTKPLKGDENVLKKIWHWFKDVNLKSSEEVVSKTAEEIKNKGLEPDAKQKEIITKEIEKAKRLRKTCQAANIGVSLILLGLIIPIFTRRNTKKKHAEALKIAQDNSSSIEKEGNDVNATTKDNKGQFMNGESRDNK